MQIADRSLFLTKCLPMFRKWVHEVFSSCLRLRQEAAGLLVTILCYWDEKGVSGIEQWLQLTNLL